jgi:hypothetical protein
MNIDTIQPLIEDFEEEGAISNEHVTNNRAVEHTLLERGIRSE